MNVVNIISSAFDSAKRRVLKFYRLGKSDVRTAYDASPYGFDGNPIKNMRAIYSETGTVGEQVIIGYINKNLLAAPGESRMFSTDDSGNLKMFIWLKKDGTMQLGGAADNAVRYAALNTALQAEKDLINIELTKIQAAITGVGGAYTKADISVNISAAKINEIKTL